MRIQNTNISIAEIKEMFERKDLITNKDYQRHSGIWPNNAKSYFIDTILNGYPFPKVYLYESLMGQTKKIRREIVDGQQRISTIIEFANDGFRLSHTSLRFRGRQFSTLDDDLQNQFLSYSVPVDMILAAERGEILEMFRRMNSFTQPLNSAEKRHSEFAGEFKWFINELADEYTTTLVNFGVLTQKQVVRMGDSELLTEFAQLVTDGIVNKSDTTLRKLYHSNDAAFPSKEDCSEKLRGTLSFIRESLGEFSNSYLFKSYVLYSLCAALMYNRWGHPAWEPELPEPRGRFWVDAESAKHGLTSLAEAHETQDVTGPFGEYVTACLSTTHRLAQRTIRARWLLRALNGQL